MIMQAEFFYYVATFRGCFAFYLVKGSESMENMKQSYYESLVEEYSDMVTRLCVVHTGNFSDAEDCYQNVFFKLFMKLDKEDIPNPKAWLIRVTLNECRSALRYRLRKSTVNLSEITSFAEDGSDLEILDLVFRLPPKYRDSIYLYYFEEMSVEEISRLTKTKVNTVKSHLRRGREQLKDMIPL